MREVSPTRVHVCHQLFRFLEAQGLPYVVVGDSRRYGTEILGDVDLVVPQERLGEVPRLLFEFCAQEGLRLVQAIQHEPIAQYYVCAWESATGEVSFVAPDVCGDFMHLGKLFLSSRELLSKRIRVDSSVGGFFVPDPAHALIYYLLKKIDKGEIDERHAEYLSTQWDADPVGAHAQVARFWSGRQLDHLIRALSGRDWGHVGRGLPEMRRALTKRSRTPWGMRAREVVRRVRRTLQPTGLMVAFFGVDGAGKTTVLAMVERDVGPAFRRTRRYHLRPFFGRHGADGPPVTDPHGKPPRGLLASLAKLGLWWADYTFGYHWDIRPRLVRSTLVLFDRYYHDLNVDSRRYRYGGPRWSGRMVGRLIPHPDLVIVLNPSPEAVRDRKQEVSPGEVARQLESYVDLARKFKVGRTVDATRPVQEVVRDVNRIILGHLAARVANRLGLTSEGDNATA